jgi:hypothetical protein
MTGRACWICGRTPATAEHVWPKWLKRISAHETSSYKMGITDDAATLREWKSGTFEHTARVLCETCNHRLGELESEVRPIVEALLAGTASSIHPDDQRTLAAWLYKTGLMVATTIKQEAASLPRAHYKELESTLDLPPASVVWVGLLDERIHEGLFVVQRFQWWDRQAEVPTLCEGYLFVLGIGELAAVVAVLDTRQSTASSDLDLPFVLDGPGIGRLLRIWPSSSHYGHRWPPPATISGPALEGMASAFAQWATQRGPREEPTAGES